MPLVAARGIYNKGGYMQSYGYGLKQRHRSRVAPVYANRCIGIPGYSKLPAWAQVYAMALYNAKCNILYCQPGNSKRLGAIIVYGRPKYRGSVYVGHVYGAHIYRPNGTGIYVMLCMVPLLQPPCPVTVRRFTALCCKHKY
jgi:hypothetical protein